MECSSCVPMEDAVQALIDHLVYPLLPSKDFFSPEPPAVAQQESVAKQIHAVVILYNYYHRKQFPQLEFLDFKSFCKSASIAKPSLLSYMKFMQSPEDVPSNIEQLSIAEKMVWDACNICTGLDEPKDISTMGSWPVSKVAVLLVDSTKMNCFLQFSSITQGVWSLIEKDLDKSFDSQLNASPIGATHQKKKSANGHLGFEMLHHEDVFQQLAFSAVKENSGITEEELTILEQHTVYSLSQQKALAQFYLMRYTGTTSDRITEFSVKDVVDSLQGPLFSEDLIVTPVVEYFHLLPYVDILSHWLSRQKSIDGLSFSVGQRNLDENVQAERITIGDIEINDRSCSHRVSEEILDKTVSNDDSVTINRKENDSYCMIRQPGAARRPHSGCKDFPLKYQHTRKTKVEAKAMESVAANKQAEQGEKITVVGSLLAHGDISEDKVNLDGLVKQPSSIEHTAPRSSSRSDACDIVSSGQGGGAVTDLPLVPMPHNPQGSDEFRLISMPFDAQNTEKFQAVMESKKRDLLEASLRVLQRKREALHHQQRLLEDEIAQCEMNLQTILTEEEGNLMLKFDSIIEACNSLCSSHIRMGKFPAYVSQGQPQKIKRRRLCEAVLSLRSPCQELDDICCENNWTLPTYSILPSLKHGGYQACVTVRGPDFECKGDGDICGNPQEARESAATHLLNKLRVMASQAC